MYSTRTENTLIIPINQMNQTGQRMKCNYVIRRQKRRKERAKEGSEEEKRMHTEEKPRKLPVSPSEGVSTNGVTGASRRSEVLVKAAGRARIPDQRGGLVWRQNRSSGTGTATSVRNLTQPSLPNPTPDSHRSTDHR